MPAAAAVAAAARNGVWGTIRARFRGRALVADVVCCGLLGGVGDILCQCGTEGRRLPATAEWRRHWRRRYGDTARAEMDMVSVLDLRRLAAVTTFTALYMGGCQHFIFQLYPFGVVAVARRILPHGPMRVQVLKESTLAHAHLCAWADNLHCAMGYIPSYFVGVGLMQGDSVARTVANLRAEWVGTYLSCTVFWVPFMTANFALVAPLRRVQAMALGNLGWCVVIDYLAHRNIGSATE
jgi:hypothetical protein